MDAFLGVWWVFPAAVLFSTVAISSGVSGALFFSPFFLLVVGLSPVQAVGAGLLTEVFGMGNGLRSYVQQKVVDYSTARWLLVGSIPGVLAGALLADRVPETLLKMIFGVGLVLLGGFLLLVKSPEECEPGEKEGKLLQRKNQEGGSTRIEATDGTVYEYPECWAPPSVAMAAGGGLLTGMISAGLPEISTTQLVVRCRLPPRVAIATSVFVLALTAVAGASIHAMHATPPWHVVGWSIPGVLVGSMIGSRIGKHVPGPLMEKVLGGVFALVGGIVLWTAS